MTDIKQDVERLKHELDPSNASGIAAAVASLKTALDPKNSQSLAATVAQLQNATNPNAVGSFANSATARLDTLQQDVLALKNKPANKLFDPQLQKGDSQAWATHAQFFKLDFSVMKADEKGLTVGGVQVMTWPWARDKSALSTSRLSEKERARRSPEALEKQDREKKASEAAVARAAKEREEAQKVRDSLEKLVENLKRTSRSSKSFRREMREISDELKS